MFYTIFWQYFLIEFLIKKLLWWKVSYFQHFLAQQCFQYSTVFIGPMNKENIPLSNESSSTICSPRKLAVSLLLFILWEILLSHGSYKTVIPKIFYCLIVSKNGSPRKPAVSFLFKRIVPKEYVHKPIYFMLSEIWHFSQRIVQLYC